MPLEFVLQGLEEDTAEETTDYDGDDVMNEIIAGYPDEPDDTLDTIVVSSSLDRPKHERCHTPEPITAPQLLQNTPRKRNAEQAGLGPSTSSISSKRLATDLTPASPPKRPLIAIVREAMGLPETPARPQPVPQTGSPSPRRLKFNQEIINARSSTRTPDHSPTTVSPNKSSRNRTPASAPRFGVETPESLPRLRTVQPTSPGSHLPVAKPQKEFSDMEIIAHDTTLQNLLTFHSLPWGVQWAIACLLQQKKLSLKDVTENVERLKGSNEDIAMCIEDRLKDTASDLESVIFSAEKEQAKGPWRALDREDTIFKERGDFACIGSEGSVAGSSFKYHGKVQFSGRLCYAEKKKSGKLRFYLEKPDLGSSCRFTRRFGSDWLIRIRCQSDIHPARLHEFFMRPFIIFGRVYRAFYASKEHTVFLAAVNEIYENGVLRTLPETPRRLCLDSLLKWHNPMDLNSNQTMAKWVARIPLGLSNSIPGLTLKTKQILEEPEIISSYWRPFMGPKPPSEMEMTDGCGFINAQALQTLYSGNFWESLPVAIQVRVAGAKGLLTRHPGEKENGSKEPLVWHRPSQTKIQYSQAELDDDPAKRTIDVLRASHMRSGIQVANEVLINLAENGVPHGIFSELLRESLDGIMEQLLQWDNPFQLYRLVAKEGGVFAARMSRLLAGEARVRGFRSYDKDEESKDDDEAISEALDLGSERSKAWHVDEISGLPSSLEETVCCFLDSGFTPENNGILAIKLEECIRNSIRKRIGQCRVEIPMSCSAWIIPDPTGTLQDGEIHIKSSVANLQGQDGQTVAQVLGPVLVTRHPCKLPTDVQKVVAVHAPALDRYVDVIVFSTKGRRSLASMLGTGDYDGDKVEAIWDPRIVGPFRSADPKFADPPSGLMDNFKRENETVVQFRERTEMLDTTKRTHALQAALLAALRDPYVFGTYSTIHDNAVYTLGYDHPETIRLAYMFTNILDGAKTGLTVREDVRVRDFSNPEHGQRMTPEWKTWSSRTLKYEPTVKNTIKRMGPTFVMDRLQADAQKLEGIWKPKMKAKFAELKPVFDKDLAKPYQDVKERAEKSGIDQMKDQLLKIEKHVQEAQEQAGRMMKLSSDFAKAATRNVSPAVQAALKTKAPFTNLPIEIRQDVLRAHSRHFNSYPHPSEVPLLGDEHAIARIRASYAYIYDWEQKRAPGSRFPYNVAMRVLCEIKANALGRSKCLSGEFYERLSMSKNAVI